MAARASASVADERDAEDRPEQVDEQVVGQAAAVRDAAALDPALAGVPEPSRERGALELGEQPALADPRLADDEGGAAATGADDVEQRRERCELLVAPDHRAVEADGLEAATPRRRRLAADHPEGVDRLGLALHLDGAEVLEVEVVAGEAARHLGDDDRPRLGGGLHPRRHVHRVAERRVLVAQVRADVADHHRPAVDAGTDPEVDPVRRA